jgi:hypothetical protein
LASSTPSSNFGKCPIKEKLGESALESNLKSTIRPLLYICVNFCQREVWDAFKSLSELFTIRGIDPDPMASNVSLSEHTNQIFPISWMQ